MVLLQIHVHQTMADAINSVLSHRGIQKSAIAVQASFLALTTQAALNVSVCYRFIKVQGRLHHLYHDPLPDSYLLYCV